MSQIRRQSIISTIIIFVGFAIGFLNNLFFTKSGWFTPEQYGLTRSFFDFSQIIFAYSFLGVSAAIYKFSPY
jgi:O-antigen/teichoic acid export membrane protein